MSWSHGCEGMTMFRNKGLLIFTKYLVAIHPICKLEETENSGG